MTVAKKKSTEAVATRGREEGKDTVEDTVASKKKSLKPKNCRRYAKECGSEAWPGIVEKLVKKAEEGSYNHTKLLVEVSGIKDEDKKPVRRKGDSVVRTLVKKLTDTGGDSAGGQRKDGSGWLQPRDNKGRWTKTEAAAGE
jgi:hypothetical protein